MNFSVQMRKQACKTDALLRQQLPRSRGTIYVHLRSFSLRSNCGNDREFRRIRLQVTFFPACRVHYSARIITDAIYVAFSVTIPSSTCGAKHSCLISMRSILRDYANDEYKIRVQIY